MYNALQVYLVHEQKANLFTADSSSSLVKVPVQKGPVVLRNIYRYVY